ncbi:MAG TPA: GH116 family glycosyl hydrolase [Planctomycetota bacterium]|jgi:hypothetical protein|nr:hypothetical protein [Planctomycetota bacterium]OQC21482.1 MAG: hypothetical protein BWX69_00968 [Planctomycetes bacterium ADurb.Bin069]NMD34264.1 hypothetical protein [Planctomycetota bacterium]HNR97760.1 GH116 family glycosyl hydrolase [Planctomycetota bacterium]HNU24773.1 GH116 family glycosyl hydrolase [Planctomycetota bacterium]
MRKLVLCVCAACLVRGAGGAAESRTESERTGIARFALEPGPLVLTREAAPWRHIEALGEQAGIWGAAGGTLEAWVYPWKLFDRFELAFSTDGGKTFRPARDLARVQTAAPHMAQLRLADDRFAATVTLFAPLRLAALAVLLDIETSAELLIAARFRPSLAPMQMAPPARLVTDYDEARGEIAAVDPEGGAVLRAGSPFAVGREALPGGLEELRLRVTPVDALRWFVPILWGLKHPLRPELEGAVDELRARMEAHFAVAAAYYGALLAEAPAVFSPDEEVNAALAWSVVSLAQLRVRNPFLGPGLVSGYGPSGDGTRPRYCWFFDEPTLSSWALLRLGRGDLVREAFTFLQRYQREDGKTVHEVAQSLAFQPDYFTAYRYAYIHTDGPVYFLAAYGHYLKSTGDLAFIRDHWPKILKTFQWCCSVVDPEDGLLGIEPHDWGSAESSFAVWKDTQLEAMWVQALRAVAYLAERMEEPALAARCRDMEAGARASIEAKLWNESAATYLWGLDRSGRPLPARVPHHAIGIWLGSFRSDRARECVRTLASADCRADWGVRSLALGDPAADPAAYQTGSVWPVWNAGLLIADYKLGRATEAFRNFKFMVRARTLDGLGPMPEVLHGRFWKRLEEGVPHQLFSELAVVNGFFDGLLGLEVDVPARRLKLAPRLPPAWSRLRVVRIPFGDERFDATFVRKDGVCDIEVLRGGDAPIDLELAPRLPAGAVVREAVVDGEACDRRVEADGTGTVVRIAFEHPGGAKRARIAFSGGIECVPVDEDVPPGGKSRNLRLIQAVLDGDVWAMTVEGLPGRDYYVEIRTALTPGETYRARVAGVSRGGFMLRLRAPDDARVTASGYARWNAHVTLR